MNTKTLGFGLLASVALATMGPSIAALADAPKPIMYIQNFSLTQDDAAAPARSEAKIEKNATSLADALAHELNARGIAAYRLNAQAPVPTNGRVISGVFSEKIPHGLFSGFSSASSSTPNTEVTISIADLATPPGTSPIVFTTPAALGGQGSSISLNPYEIAAKVVVHRVESNKSIDDLASRIATQILAQRT